MPGKIGEPTVVFLSVTEKRYLMSRAAAMRISRSELMRRIIRDWLDSQHGIDGWISMDRVRANVIEAIRDATR